MSYNNIWYVISSYFEEKGLVRQQIDSFDDFVKSTIQHVVEETPPIELVARSQHSKLQAADLTAKQVDYHKFTIF